MLTNLKRLAVAGMFLLPMGAATLHAQGGVITTTPTAEGTTITNTATASFTDVNGNTYTAVTGSVSVKVGFLAAPNPSGQLTYTPASPSTLNVAAFTIKNSGNGIDSATVNAVAGAGLTITGYSYNGTNYATAAALNAVIKLVSLASGASLPFPVDVIYSVGSSSGGASPTIVLTQTSVRNVALSASWTTTINPPVVPGVTVTPDNATIAKVPNNGTPAYSYSFTITNTGNASNTFAITRALATSNSTVVLGALSSTSVTLAAGANTTVTLNYTVLDATSDKIVVTATGTGATDAGDVTVSVSKAAITLAKTAWTLMSGGVLITNTTADAIVPGTVFYYKLAVTNTAGAADAKTVVISDPLPAALTYVSSAGDVPADWTISTAVAAGITTVTANLTPTMTAGTTRFIWVGVKITTVP